jgi:hypothetical protein
VVGAWISRGSPKVRIPAGPELKSIQSIETGFLKNESKVATFHIDGFFPGMKVQANPDLAIDIAVDEIPAPCAANDTLGNRLTGMVAAVTFVVDMIDSIVHD